MKRSLEGAAPDGRRPFPKQSKAAKFGPCAFKALVPDSMVAKLMADKGAAIHQIEGQTKSHLQFSPRGEYFPETRFRVVTVHAPEEGLIMEALATLLQQVVARAEEEPFQVQRGRAGSTDFVDGAGKYVFRCALSKAAAGAVIGNKGERVKYLRDVTGAVIDIAREVIDNHQMAVCAGSQTQLLEVLKDINTVVQNDVDAPWFLDWAEHKVSTPEGHRVASSDGRKPTSSRGPAPTSSSGAAGPSRGSSGRSEEHISCTVFVGHLPQSADTTRLREHFAQFGTVVDCDVHRDGATGRSKGFGFVTFAEPISVEAALSCPEHLVDERRVDVKAYSEPLGRAEPAQPSQPARQQGPSSREEEALPPLPPRRDPLQVHHPVQHRDVSHREPLAVASLPPRGHREQLSAPHAAAPAARRDEGFRDGYGGPVGSAPRHFEAPLAAAAPRFDAGRVIDWFAGLADQVNPDYLALDYCISCSLPSAKCGALIGRRGETVAQVQSITGATVSVSRKEPNEAPEAHRTVTITGQLLSVYAAHLLLMRHYNEKEASSERERQRAPAESAEVQRLQQRLSELTQELNRVGGRVPPYSH